VNIRGAYGIEDAEYIADLYQVSERDKVLASAQMLIMTRN
jgi:hypothetical protein